MASLSSASYVTYAHPLVEVLTAVPTGLTDLCTTDARVWQATISNTTAGTVTFKMQDKQTTPGQLIPTVSIGANTAYVIAWPEGQFASSGLSVIAGGAGLQLSLVGSYK